MPETPDPRDTLDQIAEQVASLMVVAGYMTALGAMGDDGRLDAVAHPTHGEAFTIPGLPSRDVDYVMGRLAESKAQRIDVAVSLVDDLKAQLEALRDG